MNEYENLEIGIIEQVPFIELEVDGDTKMVGFWQSANEDISNQELIESQRLVLHMQDFSLKMNVEKNFTSLATLFSLDSPTFD